MGTGLTPALMGSPSCTGKDCSLKALEPGLGPSPSCQGKGSRVGPPSVLGTQDAKS